MLAQIVLNGYKLYVITFVATTQLMRTVHLLIEGKVQGVFFRATAKDVAEQLHLCGWVKNTSEGNVEITASGEEGQIDEFIKWCKVGPSLAKVSTLSIEEMPMTQFKDFSIVR